MYMYMYGVNEFDNEQFFSRKSDLWIKVHKLYSCNIFLNIYYGIHDYLRNLFMTNKLVVVN